MIDASSRRSFLSAASLASGMLSGGRAWHSGRRPSMPLTGVAAAERPEAKRLDIALEGLRVTIEAPVQVAEGVGHCYFPGMARFPTGELLSTVSLVADSHAIPLAAQDIYISGDTGRTWEKRFTVAEEACASIKIPRPRDGRLLVLGPVRPDPPGQWRRFAGSHVCYESGGKRLLIEPGGLRIEGLPRDVEPHAPGQTLPGRVNRGVQTFCGDGLELDGRLIATLYLSFRGDPMGPWGHLLYSVCLLESHDEGRTWRHVSTIAGPEAAPRGARGPTGEGPCEPSMVQLETGELMCVMRVGGAGTGTGSRLARSYSQDGGRNWSPVDSVPAWSVAPSLRRLSNGTLVISSGRPGIHMWLSTDTRGRSWQSIDLVAQHNRLVPGPEYRIFSERRGSRDPRWTTSYTQLVEVGPNRLLMIYDRIPFAWDPVPAGSAERSRIFVMPISVERV